MKMTKMTLTTLTSILLKKSCRIIRRPQCQCCILVTRKENGKVHFRTDPVVHTANAQNGKKVVKEHEKTGRCKIVLLQLHDYRISL